MSTLSIGLLYGASTLFVMFAGMPIAFALGAVATVFMISFMPASSVDTISQNVYEEMASITLLSIPLFILKGSAIGRSRAGQDLYSAIHVWMHRIPGGLGIANVFACALFAAMAGSSPATCSAIGSAGIPEMRKRGYSPGFAAGIIAAGGTLGILLPPSITMILYAVAAEQSLGRLFLAAIGPALLLVALFAGYAVFRYRREYREAKARHLASGAHSELLTATMLSLREKLRLLPRVLPFVILLTGVMIALYGGYATPSETAGLGAVLALALIGSIYSVWHPRDLAPIESDLPALRLRYAAPGELLVLLVGRLVYEKGFHLALDALAPILRRRGGVRFVVAGTGTAEAELKRQARKLGLAGHGVFLGWIGDDMLHSLYRVSDLCIVPSIYEPFGLVALEAMASGCLCVVADTGGLREVVPVEGTVGLRFPSRDATALRGVLERVLTDDTARRQLVAEAREHVLRFDWTEVGRRTADIYDALAAGAITPAR